MSVASARTGSAALPLTAEMSSSVRRVGERKARHLLVERLHRALADADDSPRRLAVLAQRRDQFAALADDRLAQVVDPRPIVAGDVGSARGPDRVSFRGRPPHEVGHRLDALGEAFVDAARIALGRRRHVGEALVDHPRAAVGRVGKRSEPGVEQFGAFARGVGDDGLCESKATPIDARWRSSIAEIWFA